PLLRRDERQYQVLRHTAEQQQHECQEGQEEQYFHEVEGSSDAPVSGMKNSRRTSMTSTNRMATASSVQAPANTAAPQPQFAATESHSMLAMIRGRMPMASSKTGTDSARSSRKEMPSARTTTRPTTRATRSSPLRIASTVLAAPLLTAIAVRRYLSPPALSW